jgi:hypothetical protein
VIVISKSDHYQGPKVELYTYITPISVKIQTRSKYYDYSPGTPTRYNTRKKDLLGIVCNIRTQPIDNAS